MDFSQNDTIVNIKNCLMYRVMNGEKHFEHYHEQTSTIMKLFQSTILCGESNSVLLIGPRGSGKTTLVDKVLADLSTEENFQENVAVVKLNGLIHTNDKIALTGIAQNLQLENVVEDKVFGTFAENLTFLLDCLKSGNKRESRPIIFILDEFDLFCAHKNQTLLYNLFDVAASAQSPICVLGTTCRTDVIELFEKRVKSRFSHRQVYMKFDSNNPTDLKTDFKDYLILTENLLKLPSEQDCDEVELQYIKCLSKSKINFWNKSIIYLMKSCKVEDLLQYLYDLDSNERMLRNYLQLLLCNLSKKHEQLEIGDFEKTSDIFTQDDKVFLLQGLSVLEMCLIIAMKKESELLEGEPFNFKMIVQRYYDFANKASEMKPVGQKVIIKAFEHLKNLEFLIPVNKQGSKESREYQMYHFALKSEQVQEGIKSYIGLPTEIKHWFSTLAVK